MAGKAILGLPRNRQPCHAEHGGDIMQPPSIKQQVHDSCAKERALPPISIHGVVPHVITRRPLEITLGGQVSLVDRLLWAARNQPELGWLNIYRVGSKGKETLIWRDSADRACTRILFGGELPPELPGVDKVSSQIKGGK
jgi:hypothetical protein